MKKTLKTEHLLVIYRLLSAAKCSKMENADKIKVWKIQRAVKPFATKFEDDVKSANENLRPEGFAEVLEKAKRIEDAEKEDFGPIDSQQREREFVDMLTSKSKDYADFQRMRSDYVNLCNTAVKEFAEKEATVEYDPLSEDAFAKFVGSNDWTLEQISTIADFVCE